MIPGLPCDKTGALPRLVHWTGQPEPLPGRAFHRLPYNGGEHHPPPCRHQKLKWENKQKSEVLQKHYQKKIIKDESSTVGTMNNEHEQ